MEIGYVFEKINSIDNSQQFPSILTKFGLTDNTELRLITQFNIDKVGGNNENKFQPVTLGFKTKFLPAKGLFPQISFLGHISLFSKNDLNQKRIIPDFKLLFDHNLTETLSLGYNLGMEWDNNLNENYTYTVTMAKSFTPKFSVFVEAYGFSSPDFKADNRIDAGFTYFINKNSAVDISAGKGLSAVSPFWFISGGYSFRVNLK